MLEHVIKAQEFDLVLSSMNVVIRIREGTLNDEGAGVSSLACRCVIRASVPAFCQDVGDITVLEFELEFGPKMRVQW